LSAHLFPSEIEKETELIGYLTSEYSTEKIGLPSRVGRSNVTVSPSQEHLERSIKSLIIKKNLEIPFETVELAKKVFDIV
jgi:hypothetical protein